MAIPLHCPGCGTTYRVRNDLAGKRATCRCGAVLKVPDAEAASQDSAWEDEVLRAFDPPGATETQAVAAGESEPARVEPPVKAATESPTPPPVAKRPDSRPDKPKEAATGPRAFLAQLAKINVRRLYKRDPWRAVFGLAAVAYGVVSAVSFLAAVVADGTYTGLLFGETAARLAQAGLAVAIAVGGVLILERDKRGPACAALAAVLYCITPLWGILPGLGDALSGDQFLPLAWLVVRYAIPVALIVWWTRTPPGSST